MTKKIMRLAATLLAMLFCSQAFADTESYTMPRSDGKKATQTVNDALLFYDHGGPTGSLSSTWYKTLCVFTNPIEGDGLSITFSNYDLTNADVYIYDGEITAYTSVTEGYIGHVTGTGSTPLTFDAPSGTMSVLYFSTTSNVAGTGWEALIEALPSKDMEWVSASRGEMPVTYIYPGAKSVPLMCVDLLTDGGANPFTLASMGFSMTGTGMQSLTNVRCLVGRNATSPGEATQLGEALDNASASMSFSGEIPLKNKDNYVWLVADISAEATAGHSFTPSCTSAVAGGLERISAPIEAAEAGEIRNMLFMPVGPTTVKVGSEPLAFYDDGGPEANISKLFEGEVTFEPVNTGRKIRIVFEELALFNTSSIERNDRLNVYSGRSAEPSALIASLLNDPLTLSSTAEDGSLTVTFKSLTESFTTAGWKARVEEFTPQPMTATAITSESAGTATVAAGSEVAAIRFNIATSGTEPALNLTGVTLSTAGSTAPIASVSLSDASGHVLATAAPQGESVKIMPETPLALSQLGNDFIISLTPASNALSGEKLAARLSEVTLSSGGMTPSASATAEITVDNKCLLTQGEHSHVIAGEWTLANEPASSPYLGYDGAAGERKVTLTPSTEGMKIELEFESFYINWPTWGNAPSFKVYSGTTATGTPLWECTAASAKTGPDMPLRSSAADGSMTIVFNPNGNNGAKGNGFLAHICEYTPMPMNLVKAEVSQGGTEAVKGGDTDVAILRMAFTMTGDQNPPLLNEVKVNLKDAAGSVAAVKLYACGKSEDFSNANLIAHATPAPDATDVLLVPDFFRMPEKTSYYWLAYDMNTDIEAGHEIDASIASVTMGGKSVEGIITPDPEGSRPSVNVYYFADGDNTVPVTGTIFFYDNGGPDAKYTTDAKGSVTFTPAEGEIICMTFKQFYTNINDDFLVYEGTGTDGNPRLSLSSSKTGDDLPVIYSNAADGAFTVSFNPTKNNTNDGWYIEVSSVKPEDLNVQSAELTPYEGATLLRGGRKTPLARLKVVVGGNHGPVPFSGFEFDTKGTSSGTLEGLSLSSSLSIDGYDDVNEIAVSADGSLSAPGHALSEPGTYYYWLRADIASDAPADAHVAVALSSIKSGEKTLFDTATTPLEFSLASGLNGTYTIGRSENADYATIQAAADALAGGIDGPVTFLIESGDYQEKVSIPEVPGACEEHPIVFRSASGNRSDVTVHYDRYVSNGYGTPEYGVITVQGADWLTLESITVTSSSSDFPMLVKLEKVSRHFTMRDCHVHATPGTAYSDPTLVECYVNSDKVPNRNNDYATFTGCLFEGGWIGVQLGGTSIVKPALPVEVGGRIEDCTFIGQGSKAIYISSESSASILRNYIESGINAQSSYYGMDIYRASGDFLVEGNTIVHGFGKSSSSGIYLRPMRGTEETRPRIINNEIAFTEAAGNVVGINVAGSTTDDNAYVRIAHNTVSISGKATGSSAMFINQYMTGAEVINNVLVNNAEGYAMRINKAEYMPALLATNMLYAGDKFCYVAGDVADIEAWAAATGDDSSFTAEVEFLSADILEPVDFTPLTQGSPLDYAATDISGVERDKTAPTVGAYEAGDTSAAPAPAEGFPLISDVTHESARISIRANCHGVAQVMLLPDDAETPSAEDIAASETLIELRKGRTGSSVITGLTPNSSYRAWVLLTSLRGITGEPVATEVFTTSYLPTTVSTFEDVKPVEGNEEQFEDGTARFAGFLIEERENLPVPGSVRVAVMEDTEASIVLTNAPDLVLDGFWLDNEAEFTISAYDADEQKLTEKVLPASSWRYVNLRDMGPLSAVRFYTEGAAAIDDFCGAPLPLSTSIEGAEERIAQGAEFTLTAIQEGGVAPFTYEWSNSLRDMIGNGSTLSRNAEVTGIYSLTVTDAWGAKAEASVRVSVTGDMAVGTFDDLYLAPESEWVGDIEDPDYSSGTFLTGSFELNNFYMAEYRSWSWFGYASHTSTEYADLSDQMHCAAGGGLDGSANYGVAFMGEYYGPTLMSFTNTTGSQRVPGLWLTNSAWVKDAVYYGDGMSDEFSKGDYCSVKISGLKEDGGYTEPVEFRLADYTADDEADHFCIDTWQWCSLAELGEVKGLRFEFFSTKSNSYGITTPSYVCIDNLGDACPVEEADPMTVHDDLRSIELAPLFGFAEGEGTPVYTLLDGQATISGSQAVVTAPMSESTTLLIKGTQRGCSRWISLPVNVTTAGVGVIDASMVTGIDIFTPSGIHVFTGTDMPELPSGIYIIVRHTPDGDMRTVERR